MSRVVFFLIGLLLAVTAILKLWMLLTDPFADLTAQLPRSVLWVAFYVEFSLVLILASRLGESVKWGTALLVFIGFWLFSCFRLILGYSSCGCTGSLSVPPSISVMLNTGVIAFLIYCRPARLLANGIFRSSAELGRFQNWRRVLGGHLLSFALACACVVAFVFIFAPFSSEAAFSAESVDVGAVVVGETVSFECKIKNLTSKQTRIIGSKSACNCLVVVHNDASIPGEGVLVQQCQLNARKEGPLRQRLLFYTDNPIQGSVCVNVSGIVLPLPVTKE